MQMKCQLVSILDAGRRSRRIYAYPLIWWRMLGCNVRWYVHVAARMAGAVVGPGKGKQVHDSPHVARQFGPGEWVRVRTREEIDEQETRRDEGDVVAFIPAPMTRYCGKVFRVLRVLENYYDEVREGLAKAEDAVLLEGARCDGSQLGRGRQCERECLHFWKSSWLEPVAGPGCEETVRDDASRIQEDPAPVIQKIGAGAASPQGHEWHSGDVVRVRERSAIEGTLDEHGTHEGIPFVAEHMAFFCGRVCVVAKPLSRFFDEKADYTIRLSRAYLLSGVSCDGRQAAGEPHCDRSCALVWHQAWLESAAPLRAGSEHGARSGLQGRAMSKVAR